MVVPPGMTVLTSVRTCMPTLSCPEAPPCTLVLLTVCRRRSLPLLHPPSRSRSLLHQRGSTLSGSEDPSLPPSQPSSRCGSPSRNMMSAAHPLFTASASKFCVNQYCFQIETSYQLNKEFIKKQVGAELGQAQLKLGLDFNKINL